MHRSLPHAELLSGGRPIPADGTAESFEACARELYERAQAAWPGFRLEPSDFLPYVRERELCCACQLYGIHPPRFLDYQDGQLTIVNQGQAVGRLVRIIRDLQPQVIITFGPDGILGITITSPSTAGPHSRGLGRRHGLLSRAG